MFWHLKKRGCAVVGLCAAGWVMAGLSCRNSATSPATGADQSASGKRFTVVATTGMVADLVRNVAGEDVDVVGIIGTGVDPHLYRPTSSDTAQMMSADVIFYSGLILEGQMQAMFSGAAEQGKPVYAVTDCLAPTKIRHPEGFEGHPDPHVWMDVALWSECAGFVAEKLSEFDPDNADAYRANCERYQMELQALDTYVRVTVASIPEEQRNLVTAHDAFEYFSAAYEIPVRSVLGISTESQAGVEDINSLVDFLVANKIPAVFVESSVSDRNLRAVIEGAGQRGWSVREGGTLFSDAMGAPGAYEGTYIGMLDHNATVVARALGGTAPERGMQGRLSLIDDAGEQ